MRICEDVNGKNSDEISDKQIFIEFSHISGKYDWVHCFCIASGDNHDDTRYAVELRDEPGVYYISEGPSTTIDKKVCRRYTDKELAKMHLMML